ncbi:4989_t:CDS:2 [Gigaspora margarita]|uniref:4989_t:CDS:1 n=1 Tax=Gigaspora margarita TaxID=4874 RepID=A0ABN7W1T0_GIGMA|nr:4989_t:CDS:2 [Gigaspora margarita]
MSNTEYFKKFSTEYPNPFNYFYSKVRLGTFTYDKTVEHMNYEKDLTDSINSDFPKKEQLLKARRDWAVKIPKEIHEIIARFSDNYDEHDNLNENESEDPSLVEFHSYEIKNKISNEKLSPRDLLPNGIVHYKFLRKYHKRLFDLIIEHNCLEELSLSKTERNQYKTILTIEEKNFKSDHIKYGHCAAPNSREDAKTFYKCLGMFLNQLECTWELLLYIQKSSKINESSYSHQVVKSVCDLLLYNIKGINIEYNGPSESTQNRNGGQSGPTRLPDLMVSKHFSSPNYKWEFMFCEISNGPYALDWDHYWGDELRLGKFSKDSWNNAYLFTQGIDASNQFLKKMMDEVNPVMIHFYETKMDVYILDRKMKPFCRMCLVKSLEIPLINDNEQKTIQMVNKLCKEDSPTAPPNLVGCDNLLPTLKTPEGPNFY